MINNNNKLIGSGRALLMIIFMIAVLFGIKPEIAFSSEYGYRGVDIVGSEIIPATEVSELSSAMGSSEETIANQQNQCQGNIVICQNILTKFICTQKAICIIGNLDPFLLVMPN
jgi:hypothetical protein